MGRPRSISGNPIIIADGGRTRPAPPPVRAARRAFRPSARPWPSERVDARRGTRGHAADVADPVFVVERAPERRQRRCAPARQARPRSARGTRPASAGARSRPADRAARRTARAAHCARTNESSPRTKLTIGAPQHAVERVLRRERDHVELQPAANRRLAGVRHVAVQPLIERARWRRPPGIAHRIGSSPSDHASNSAGSARFG